MGIPTIGITQPARKIETDPEAGGVIGENFPTATARLLHPDFPD